MATAPNFARGQNRRVISDQEVLDMEEIVQLDQEVTARHIKATLGLRASEVTICRYLRSSEWKKKNTK